MNINRIIKKLNEISGILIGIQNCIYDDSNSIATMTYEEYNCIYLFDIALDKINEIVESLSNESIKGD